HALGAADLLGIARHHDRLRQSFLARGALERFRRRVQIARAVIDDGDGHRGAPGCGNKPMTSDDGRRAIATPIAGDDARGAPSAADWSAQDLLTQVLLTHASKKRRSADSRSSPTTMPTFVQPRRDSLKRRNVAASKPTRSEKSAPAMSVTVVEAPAKRSATESAMARMTKPVHASQSRCRSIHHGASKKAQNEKPSRTKTKRSGLGADSCAFSGGSYTV